MNKKANFYKILIVSILFASCGLKTYTLSNGHSKAAVNKKVYKNSAKFDRSLLSVIDTSVVYEKFIKSYYVGTSDQKVLFNDVARKNKEDRFQYYGAYKFYENGNFNYFTIDGGKVLDEKMLDPEATGSRGVVYKEGNEIKGDLITLVTGMGRMGKITEKFVFSGDTLTVSSSRGIDKYVKMKLPSNFTSYKAAW